MALYEELCVASRKIDSAFGPLAGMLSTRRFRKSVLQKVVVDAREALESLEKILESL